MDIFFRIFCLFVIWIGSFSAAHAAVYAYDIYLERGDALYTNFDINWRVQEYDPESNEWCHSFQIEVVRLGSGVYEFLETINCGQTTFRGRNYPAGDYEVYITTVSEVLISGDVVMEQVTANPVLVAVGGQPSVELSELAEGFELDMGLWINTGNYSWLRRVGSTPSSLTGPNRAAQGANYLFVETSSGQGAFNAGDTAILESPTFTLSREEFHFKYHMYGSNIGNLRLEFYNAGQWHVLWSQSGPVQNIAGSPWKDVWVSMVNYSGSGKLRFVGLAAGGYMGDMAIDDISLRPSVGIVTQYAYDALGRLRAVEENGAAKESYQYDRAGNLCTASPDKVSDEGYCDE